MHHVIVGAGPAGTLAADILRQQDETATITLLGDEPEPPYGRMAIPYLLSDQIGVEGTHLRKVPNHFKRQRIDLRHACANALNATAHELRLEDGDTLRYDRLLIATGARPNRPPIQGLDHPAVLSCWTLADAREIIRRARPGTRTVLIGAGFIGCIVLESLLARGVRLTVVEQTERMVPRMLDATAGGMLARWTTDKGVDLRLGCRVRVAEPNGAGLTLRLDDGTALEADLVILATGVVPNASFLAGSGIDIDLGVLVQDTMATSLPDVYAAGDVAQGRGFQTSDHVVHAIQPVAVDHGRIAALNMAGQEAHFHGALGMNILDTLGLITTSFGRWEGVEGGDQAELVDRERFRYLNLQFDGEQLVGATAVGVTQHIGALRGLIQSGIRLGTWKRRLCDDPSRLMEAFVALVATP